MDFETYNGMIIAHKPRGMPKRLICVRLQTGGDSLEPPNRVVFRCVQPNLLFLCVQTR